MSREEDLLKRVYAGFNSRDIDGALAALHADVVTGWRAATSAATTACAAIGRANGRRSIRMSSR